MSEYYESVRQLRPTGRAEHDGRSQRARGDGPRDRRERFHHGARLPLALREPRVGDPRVRDLVGGGRRRDDGDRADLPAGGAGPARARAAHAAPRRGRPHRSRSPRGWRASTSASGAGSSRPRSRCSPSRSPAPRGCVSPTASSRASGRRAGARRLRGDQPAPRWRQRLHVVVEADEDDAFARPENLRRCASSRTGSSATRDRRHRVAGRRRDVAQPGLPRERPEAAAIPEARLIRQLLLFGGDDVTRGFVDTKLRSAHVSARSTVGDSEPAALLPRIDDRLAQLPTRLRARVTGDLVLLSRTVDEIARGELESIGLALLTIYLTLSRCSCRSGSVSSRCCRTCCRSRSTTACSGSSTCRSISRRA